MRVATLATFATMPILVIASAACGGAMPEAKSSAAQRSEEASPAAAPSEPAVTQSKSTAGGAYAQPPSQGAMPTTPAPQSPWLEFQSANGTFDATTSDCAVACKALASIDRATGHVCSLADGTDHCSSARDTLKSARKKVRAECTICPAGPTTDPEGPIPSVP